MPETRDLYQLVDAFAPLKGYTRELTTWIVVFNEKWHEIYQHQKSIPYTRRVRTMHLQNAREFPQEFAHKLCTWLDMNRREGRFHQVALVAEQWLLDLVLPAMNKDFRAMVKFSVAENWVPFERPDKEDRMRALVFPS